jgi:hypothetical protein
MSEELKYPEWQQPLQEALVEFDPQKMRVKMQKAEAAIHDRLQTLVDSDHLVEEREALTDGLSTLRTLKRDKSLASYELRRAQSNPSKGWS